MDLYLIRHAEAVPRDDPQFADEDRPLTDEGREQTRQLAKSLLARNVQFDAVIASPLLRTRQTAEELLQNMPGPMGELEFCKHLAPGGKERKLTRYILGQSGDSIALIGHEPDLSQFAAMLIGSRKAQIELEKGGVALIRCEGVVDKGHGTLVWLLTPEWTSEPTAEPAVAGAW